MTPILPKAKKSAELSYHCKNKDCTHCSKRGCPHACHGPNGG